MLDTNHPQARHIFDASGIQNQIYKLLAQVAEGQLAMSELGAQCEPHIQALEALNQAHFKASTEIQETLGRLRTLLNSSQEIESMRWDVYQLLEVGSTPNFGTWAI